MMVIGDLLKWNLWDIVVLCRGKQTVLSFSFILLGGSNFGNTWINWLWKTECLGRVRQESYQWRWDAMYETNSYLQPHLLVGAIPN